jgi:starch synthase (maltosyl-transferring)
VRNSTRRIALVLLSLSAFVFGAALSPIVSSYCPWNGQMTTKPCPEPEAYQAQYNGILRLYNLFPRNYADIDAMTADLPRIRDMGFTHVWLNPLHETTAVEKKKWPEGTPNGLKGSLYSMRDPHMINPDFSVVPPHKHAQMTPDEIWEEDKAALKRFTAKASELGMVPMFDLVLSHLAPDSAIVEGTDPHYQAVDTKPWFARYANGKPKRHGLDQDGNILPGIQYPDKEVWDDVVMLKYDDPKIRAEITEHLWKPFVQTYYDLGFRGIRVDSVANNDRDVMRDTIAHFRELFHKDTGMEPTILGESLGGTMEQQGKIRGQATHLYNSAYWLTNLTGPNISNDKRDARAVWADPNNWFLQESGQKQDIIFKDADGQLIEGRKGGTVGYAGSHDELPWIYHFPRSLPPIEPLHLDEVLFKARELNFPLDKKAAVLGLREKVAVAALASDGGWFMTSFDDKADTTLRSVFDKHMQDGESLADLSGLVKDINNILRQMPQTQAGSWSKRHFLPGRDGLVIIERHTGYGHEGPSNLVLINADPEQDISLKPAELRKLAQLTGRNAQDIAAHKGGVWTGSNITLPAPEQVATLRESFADRLKQAREKVLQGYSRHS